LFSFSDQLEEALAASEFLSANNGAAVAAAAPAAVLQAQVAQLTGE